MTDPAPLRFGVLGCADIAGRRTLPALPAAGAVVTAVASRDAGRAAAFADRFGAVPVTGYRALLGRDDVDAVYVPLPVALHQEWACAALAAGKHVLVEKSATTDAAGARELVATAERHGLLVMENFTFPWHAQHAAVRTVLADGLIGEPRLVTAEFGVPPTASTGIRYRRDLGGGSLRETGCYPIRLAWSLLAAETTTVAGAVLVTDPGTGVDVAGSVLLRDAAGLAAQCSFGMTHAYRNTYAIWGSTGRLSMSWAFTPPPTATTVLRVERQDHVEERTLPPDDQFRNTLRRFVRLVRDPAGRAPEHRALIRQATLLEDVERAAAGR